MKISINILLEYWKGKGYDIEYFGSIKNAPSYNEIHLLPAAGSILNKDVLYVGYLSEALTRERNGSTIFCVRDRMQDDKETVETMHNIAVMRHNIALNEMFNETAKLFGFLQRWSCKMYEALSTGCGVEAVFDIIEELRFIYPDEMFNFVHATDADFSLLGYTSGIEIDDPIMNNLISTGRYGAENVHAFEKFNCAQEWERSYAYPMISQIKLLKYPVVIKTARFAFGFVQIVMVCNNLEPAPGLIELFNVVADVLIRCIHTTISLESRVNYPFHKLLQRLIKGEKAIPARLGATDTLGIPLEGLFDVFVVSWLDTSDYKLERALQDIYTALPESFVAAYDGQILTLNVYKNTDRNGAKRQSKMRLERIEHVWAHYNAVCGVSSVFENLGSLAEAFKQANVAIECAHQLTAHADSVYTTEITARTDERICIYDELCVFEFFRGEKSTMQLFKLSEYASALIRLKEDDEKHHRDNCRVLHAYLSCERSPSKAAVLLNMHKNNVIYRMQKIESVITCDLDDPEVRFKLLIAYKYLNWIED